MPERGPIRIVVADDHPIFRQGLQRLLASDRRFRLVGEADNGADALELVHELRPEVLLLDLAMPRMPGLAVLRELGQSQLGVRCVVLTASAETAVLDEALACGARGIVLKDCASEVLLECLAVVAGGGTWFTDGQLSRLAGGHLQASAAAKPPLTDREVEIVDALANGLSNKEIAAKLGISEHTVKHHLTSVYQKLQVAGRLELVVRCSQGGWRP